MKSESTLNVYIGWDSREDIAYEVCRRSMLARTTHPVKIKSLKRNELKSEGLYNRKEDPLASTEFTYTRFLVPYLNDYKGWALFCDCDFLWLSDVSKLLETVDNKYAVMCVKHDYRPKEKTKMDGSKQTVYPRKNWSSMVLYNCSHPKNKILTPDLVNTETGAFLHRFQWLNDNEIGGVHETWNWLEGWSEKPTDGTNPNVIHFTRGGPWFESWKKVDYATEWNHEKNLLMEEDSNNKKYR